MLGVMPSSSPFSKIGTWVVWPTSTLLDLDVLELFRAWGLFCRAFAKVGASGNRRGKGLSRSPSSISGGK